MEIPWNAMKALDAECLFWSNIGIKAILLQDIVDGGRITEPDYIFNHCNPELLSTV